MRRAETSSDGWLVGQLAEGRQTALAELYRRHGAAVWGVCLAVCRDRTLAEDACQAVFCEVWSSPGRFDGRRGGFRPWLLALAHARAVDLVRSEAARRRREEAHGTATLTQAQAQAGLSTLSGEVRAAVAELPEEERTAIVLTYFGGHTYRDAARLLGQPEGTVKSRIRSGLHRLRAHLEVAGVLP